MSEKIVISPRKLNNEKWIFNVNLCNNELQQYSCNIYHYWTNQTLTFVLYSKIICERFLCSMLFEYVYIKTQKTYFKTLDTDISVTYFHTCLTVHTYSHLHTDIPMTYFHLVT